MKKFAEIDSKKIVTRVLAVNPNRNQTWLTETLGGTWIESTEARKNPAGIGYTYDSKLDAFIPPKRFDSWVFNEETCQWEAPVQYPTDGKNYVWNEETISWDEIQVEEE